MSDPSIRTILIAGNWKLNGTRASATELARAVAVDAPDCQAELLICPPSIHVAEVASVIDGSGVKLGGQSCCHESAGAFTGETSASMLAEYGCCYVIVGHSERRSLFGETDADVAARFSAAQAAGLTPILCVGESLAERQADEVEVVIARQLDAVLTGAGVAAFREAVIAYEPVWAIGTGETASPEQAQAVHAMIRARVASQDAATADALRILYGGSMKPSNAAELLAQADIDGGLIGGAALDAEAFLAIAAAAPV